MTKAEPLNSDNFYSFGTRVLLKIPSGCRPVFFQDEDCFLSGVGLSHDHPTCSARILLVELRNAIGSVRALDDFKVILRAIGYDREFPFGRGPGALCRLHALAPFRVLKRTPRTEPNCTPELAVVDFREKMQLLSAGEPDQGRQIGPSHLGQIIRGRRERSIPQLRMLSDERALMNCNSSDFTRRTHTYIC
jgi:hypothetical protein